MSSNAGIELKCDSAAAVVLATGEGSWRKLIVADLRFRTSELRINAQIH